SGGTVRTRVRRSVYFHVSIRRWCSPFRSKNEKAASRRARADASPGRRERSARKAATNAASALGRMVRVAAVIALASRRRSGELGAALALEPQRRRPAARADDAAGRGAMGVTGQDIAREPLVVGDDEHRPLRRAELV